MSKAFSIALALLAVVAIPATIAIAGKSKTLTHKGKVGISAKVEPGESFVPKSGGAPIKLKFEQKGQRLKKLKLVDFDEIYYICKKGTDVIAKDVRIGGAKISKAKKNRPPSFRYREQGADAAFGAVGLTQAKSFSLEFTGTILDRGNRATGKLRSDFNDRTYGTCSTGSQVWRSEK